MKKKILFYTDCPIFGGCEKPVYEVISSDEFASRYDFTVIFRSTKEYLEGRDRFWPSFPKDKFLGIRLFDISTVNYRLAGKIKNALLLKMAGKCVTFIFMPITPLIFIYDLLLLSALFRRNKADIIHINNGGYPGALSCRSAAVAAKYAGFKRIIFSVHNTAFRNRGFVGRIIDSFVKRSVDHIVTGSAASALALAENRGFDRRKMITIYHGVRESGAGNKNLPLGEGPAHEEYITMVARFEDRKGHRYAIEAFKNVLDNNPSFSAVKLVLIGDGPILADIKNMVISSRIDNNVRFMGHRDDYIDYVASGLFLINPSTGYEDLPYIILEAMSLGVPVIGTNIAGIPEEIDDGVTGMLVPPKDTGALAQAILSLLSDKNKRIRMGTAAAGRFRDLFTIDKMREKYFMLYEWDGRCG